MKVILQKVWAEPAVFIGLVVTLGLLAAALIAHTHIDAGVIVGILAPLASALGIRQLVTPVEHDVQASAVDTDGKDKEGK